MNLEQRIKTRLEDTKNTIHNLTTIAATLEALLAEEIAEEKEAKEMEEQGDWQIVAHYAPKDKLPISEKLGFVEKGTPTKRKRKYVRKSAYWTNPKLRKRK